jgi:glutathione S-transferase
MALILLAHPLASFCHKVLIALYETGVPFEQRMVDLGDPAGRAEFLKISPFGKMPVLVDEARGRTLYETSIIIEYLDRHYPAARPLLPVEPEARLDVRLWDRVFDLYVQQPLQAAVAGVLGGRTEPEPQTITALDAAYRHIEAHMAGRTWAAGDDFSLADCAATPALFYARCVSPIAPRFPTVAAYFERLIARPSAARVLVEARPYLQYFPLKDRLEPRFLGEGA